MDVVPISIKKSEVPFPCKINGHGVVTWKNSIVVWGPRNWKKGLDLYFHIAGKWIKKKKSGDIPIFKFSSEQAHVLNANMFVLGQENHEHLDGTVKIYSLDLNTCKWTKFIPNGVQPLIIAEGVASWVHKDKIYFFGGINPHDQQLSNQIFCYNISTNSWEWPEVFGDIPAPRRDANVISTNTLVALFGGSSDPMIGGVLYHNDLHVLDKDTLSWKKVHGDIPIGQGPRWNNHDGNPTLTCISKSTAVLLVSFYDHQGELVDGCWILNIDKAEQGVDPSSIWTKIEIPNIFRRRWHRAVLEPASRQLWAIRGSHMLDKGTSEVVQINLIQPTTPTPLKDITIHHVVTNICIDDQSLSEYQLPRHLRNDIEAYRSKFPGDNACLHRNKCMACLLAANPTTQVNENQDQTTESLILILVFGLITFISYYFYSTNNNFFYLFPLFHAVYLSIFILY